MSARSESIETTRTLRSFGGRDGAGIAVEALVDATGAAPASTAGAAAAVDPAGGACWVPWVFVGRHDAARRRERTAARDARTPLLFPEPTGEGKLPARKPFRRKREMATHARNATSEVRDRAWTANFR